MRKLLVLPLLALLLAGCSDGPPSGYVVGRGVSPQGRTFIVVAHCESLSKAQDRVLSTALIVNEETYQKVRYGEYYDPGSQVPVLWTHEIEREEC